MSRLLSFNIDFFMLNSLKMCKSLGSKLQNYYLTDLSFGELTILRLLFNACTSPSCLVSMITVCLCFTTASRLAIWNYLPCLGLFCQESMKMLAAMGLACWQYTDNFNLTLTWTWPCLQDNVNKDDSFKLRGLVSKETVVLRQWESETENSGFINWVHKANCLLYSVLIKQTFGAFALCQSKLKGSESKTKG